MKIKEVSKKSLTPMLLLVLSLTAVAYTKSASYITIPLFTQIEDMLIANDGYLKVKGELSGVDVDDYHGAYGEEWSFYQNILGLLKVEDNRASVLEKVYKKNSEGLDFLIQTIKVGKKLWEYSKIIAAIEYGNSVLFVTEHKIKDYYAVIFIKIIKENGHLYIDMSRANDFLMTELINLSSYNRKNHSTMVFPESPEQNLSDSTGWTKVNLIDGVEYIFKSSGDNSPEENLQWNEMIKFLETEPRTFRKVEKLISKESAGRYKRWLKSMSVNVNDQDFIHNLIRSEAELSYIGMFRINDKCKAAYFSNNKVKDRKEVFYICATDKGVLLNNLMVVNDINKRYKDEVFVRKLF
jgi:hypothetical protein